MKSLATAFLALTFSASPLLAGPDIATCRAMNAKYEAENPGVTKPSPAVLACFNAVLEADEQKLRAQNAATQARIEQNRANAPKLPAE